jgi:hypothetical protein
MGAVGLQPLRLDEVRTRLRRISDEDLLRSGRDAADLCRPGDQSGHKPRQVFVQQLNEARAEPRRRHSEETGER